MIHSLSQLDIDKTYTYADYLTWQFEQLVELVKGKIFPMSAPSRLHQKISRRLSSTFDYFLEKNGCACELYYAPFDVRLVKNPFGKTEKEIYTVVQPDICVICDLEKLDDKGCLGSPDLIIEIVSPNNSQRDVKDKFELYQENEVKEYWIVRPYENTVEQFFLENGKYAYKGTFVKNDCLSPLILPDLEVDLKRVFEQ